MLSLALLACGSAQQARILVVGDLMLDRDVRQAIARHGADWPFAEIAPVFSGHDLVVANLEGPLTEHPSEATARHLVFTFDPALAPVLRRAGFTTLGLANNHTFDFGPEGLTSTRKTLADAGLSAYGDPRNASDLSTIATVDGLRVALVGYSQFGGDVSAVTAEIARVRSLADYVIVSPHWGTEYDLRPTMFERVTARAFVAAGADLVAGSHPHVVQPSETVDGKSVWYSLGNFLFDQEGSAATRVGLALDVTLTRDGTGPVTATIAEIPLDIARGQVRAR